MPTPAHDLVHGRLAHWAQVRGDAVALDDGHTRLNFAQLHQAVTSAAAALAHAPATVFVHDAGSTVQQVVDFLAIVHTGRCAAVSDPDWPAATRVQVAQRLAGPPTTSQAPGPDTPFYVGFTSGSTGLPKGFRRHHRSWTESFQVCVDTFGPAAQAGVLAPGRASHSLFLFGILHGLWTGAGVVVQDRFSAARALDTLRQGRTPCLVAVPSQLVMMLSHAARRALPPVPEVALVLISGARWMRERTAELQALFPQAQLVTFYGASETSFIAWMNADEAAPPQAVGRPFGHVELSIRTASGESSADNAGLIFVRSPMLFMDYVGAAPDATAALRDGDWLSVRDMGYIDAQGYLCLVGRESRMLVTQGKNLFPEEVEAVLSRSPSVQQVSVQSVPDPVRGQQVVALVQAADAGPPPSAQDLASLCRAQLEPYKVPKRFFTCTPWPLTPSGKTDHPALAQRLALRLNRPSEASDPCLQPLL
jgi:acyl-CoA synthetase (AMP-forming)/AMP-acid ligase II